MVRGRVLRAHLNTYKSFALVRPFDSDKGHVLGCAPRLCLVMVTGRAGFPPAGGGWKVFAGVAQWKGSCFEISRIWVRSPPAALCARVGMANGPDSKSGAAMLMGSRPIGGLIFHGRDAVED